MEFKKERALELSQNLEKVRDQIATASQDVSQVRNENSPLPRLTVVTKFFPASDVLALYSMGVRDVGENRDQEASAKATELIQVTEEQDALKWAYIGQLQSNKAKSVVKYATEVHSVDRLSLVSSLQKAYSNQIARWEAGEGVIPAAYSSGGLRCFIQVSLEDDVEEASSAHRGGARPSEVLTIADSIAETDYLECAGVMAVAPLGMNSDKAFERLYGISENLQASHSQASEISAGMSSDLEAAIRWGSTNVRVGSQIMGSRPSH